MVAPVISVFHHKFGLSVAIVHGEDPADYWARVDGYKGGDGVEWLESFDLPPLFAAAPELLAALKTLRVQFGDYKDGDGAAKFHSCNIADAAINKAEGKVK